MDYLHLLPWTFQATASPQIHSINFGINSFFRRIIKYKFDLGYLLLGIISLYVIKH